MPRGPIVAVTVLLGVLGGGELYAWRAAAERRAVEEMAAPRRALLFREELGAFKVLCTSAPPPEPWADRCATHALFLLRFPECDAACRELSRASLPGATR